MMQIGKDIACKNLCSISIAIREGYHPLHDHWLQCVLAYDKQTQYHLIMTDSKNWKLLMCCLLFAQQNSLLVCRARPTNYGIGAYSLPELAPSTIACAITAQSSESE